MLNPAHAQRLLPATIALMIVVGVAIPARYLGWVNHFGWLVTTLVAPISHPLAAFSRWASPASALPQDNEQLRMLREELEARQQELLRRQLEIDRLTRALEDMNVFSAVNPAPVRQVDAPIFASSSDLSSGVLRARAGTREGVEAGSVATTSGMQLVGRVLSVSARTCDIMPFTDRAAGPIQGVIIFDGTPNGLVCKLEPTGEGTVRGPVEDRRDASGAAIEPRIGQQVRLNDPGRWPRDAQMLLLGTVVAVETSPDGPLRKVVTVRPTIERLERVSEVVLRTAMPGGGR
ncbi:MAG: hypothetical protein KF864_15205 [Phycisphaeraceae bacterium]|nr:hypothetical protein [Phycisphaeraceae bacterium]